MVRFVKNVRRVIDHLFAVGGVIVVCGAFHFPTLRADDGKLPHWAQDGYGASADGQSPYRGPQNGKLKWMFGLDRWACSPVVGADSTVYVGTNNGTFYAIDKEGREKWKRQWPIKKANVTDEERRDRKAAGLETVSIGHVASCALGRDGTIYVAQSVSGGDSDEDRHIIALDTTGKDMWRYSVARNNIATKITLGPDDTILFGTTGDQTSYHSLSREGKLLWSRKLGVSRRISSSAVGRDNLIYVAGERISALDPRDGSIKFEYAKPVNSPTGLYGPAVGPDGTVYVAAGVGAKTGHLLFAFNPDLSLKWTLDAGCMELTPAIAADGTIYIHTWGDNAGFGDGKTKLAPGFHAIKPDGTVKWSLDGLMKVLFAGSERPNEPINIGSDSSPILGSDGVVYCGSDIGKVFAVHPEGKLLWQLEFGGEFDTRPAIGADGTLYVCHAGGPGGKPDGRPRCYAISDDGKLDPITESNYKTALRREIARAKKAGDEREVRELEALLKDKPPEAYWKGLRDKNKKEATETDGKNKDDVPDKAEVSERIARLKKELAKAQKLGNEAEVREIQEQLRRLEFALKEKPK